MWDAEAQGSRGRGRMILTSLRCMEAKERARSKVRALGIRPIRIAGRWRVYRSLSLESPGIV
jgi:hypothetical protein